MIEFHSEWGGQGIGRSNGSFQNRSRHQRFTTVQPSGNNVPRATTSALYADPNPPTGITLLETQENAWLSLASGSRGGTKAASNYAKPAGPTKLLQQIMSDWGLNDAETAILLGFEEASVVETLYRGLTTIKQRDAKDRLRSVLLMAADLSSLYRESAAVRDWLREPQAMLDGAAPIDLLKEGSMENLLRVRQYVEYLSGR